MLVGLTWLLIFQCLGEGLSYVFHLPVPGPVIGMILLFVALYIRQNIPNNWLTASTTILSNLSLLFIPAGVGVIIHGKKIANEWLAISLALLISTALAITITALSLNYFIRRKQTPLSESQHD